LESHFFEIDFAIKTNDKKKKSGHRRDFLWLVFTAKWLQLIISNKRRVVKFLLGLSIHFSVNNLLTFVAFDNLVTGTYLLFSFLAGWCCDYHDFESVSTQR